MKIYLISGYDFDPTEWQRCSVAHVFKTRQEAEHKFHEYMEDAASILNSSRTSNHTQCDEHLYITNGNKNRYTASVRFDMADKEQRADYIDTISAGFLCEDKYVWPPSIESHDKELRLVDISIREVEL